MLSVSSFDVIKLLARNSDWLINKKYNKVQMLCQCDNNGRYTKTNFRQKKVPDRLKLCGKIFRPS